MAVLRALLLCLALTATSMASECGDADLTAINASASGCSSFNMTASTNGSSFGAWDVCATSACQNLLTRYRNLNCTVNGLTGSDIASITCPNMILRPRSRHHHNDHGWGSDDDDCSSSVWNAIVLIVVVLCVVTIGIYVWKRHGQQIRRRLGWINSNSYFAATSAADADVSNVKFAAASSTVLVPTVQLQGIQKGAPAAVPYSSV
ncbi:hypothetical protein SPRG_03244 [Saprolegnia parasitica CBS 223.65]|uniref:Elicitin n=1 Tax=Saprolegnia parasitica (strain CBS 223.65) TaxID=695850 RepID=A0A067CYY6_SAPPC|nr:hypothetical protein SPRG_03244 [Saprolegnia parasitica CBS 223.65]KDO32027.1 hypothetical protein SPRG_03244 [Saprolegnia parasitica CBS 223.65]|eukprot:XP_012197217.1 hypothetical protein SPRG_03244 [Saprolegnia parasitica CBS 223.65]